MKLNPMIFPDLDISEFIIKEEVQYHSLQPYKNALILSQKNILHKWEYYDKHDAILYRVIYIQTRYGIIKGYRVRINRKGQMDFAYRILEVFKTDSEAFWDYLILEEVDTNREYSHWVVFRGKSNQLMLCESDIAEKRQYTQEIEDVECKSTDTNFLDFEIDYTNNLGVKFRVRCKKLHCLVRWIKYKGKIYRTVRYRTQAFGIEVNGKFGGINHITKSEYIEHIICILTKHFKT